MTRYKYYHTGYSCNGKIGRNKYMEFSSDTEYTEYLREEEDRRKKLEEEVEAE